MQTVLVITDFKIEALDCVPQLSEQVKSTELSFVFMHLFKLSDSITDLLMLSRRSREFEHISDEFHNRCRELERTCKNVKSIRVDFFYGSTVSMFRNYLEANEVNYILDPSNCSVGKINKSSIDAEALIKKAGTRVIRLQKVEAVQSRQEAPVLVHEEELTEALT
jgi:hypothetical protein